MTGSTRSMDGQCIAITNRDKVLFPDAGLTKGDLIAYYARIAPRALPYYRGRALTMHRFPDGITDDGFYQKAIPDYFPDRIDRATFAKADGEITQVVANTAATFVYIANRGCISRLRRPMRRTARIGLFSTLTLQTTILARCKGSHTVCARCWMRAARRADCDARDMGRGAGVRSVAPQIHDPQYLSQAWPDRRPLGGDRRRRRCRQPTDAGTCVQGCFTGNGPFDDRWVCGMGRLRPTRKLATPIYRSYGFAPLNNGSSNAGGQARGKPIFLL